MIDWFSSITTGTAASLGVSLVIRPVWSWVAARNQYREHSTWIPITTRSEFRYIAAHAVAGAFQGWLFWLSWGLAAITINSWWLHGLVVGMSFSIMMLIPMLLIAASVIRFNQATWKVLIGETLATCNAVALACSWMWLHGR
jgi:hypothetical protein